MIELSTVRDLVAILGAIIALSYYIMTIRNQRKNQKLSALHELIKEYSKEEFLQRWLEVLDLEWDDYSNFIEKFYDDKTIEPKYTSIFNYFEGIGRLWKNGVIDLETIGAQYIGMSVLYTWWKFKPIVEGYRKHIYSDVWLSWQEFSEALEPLIKDKLQIKGIQQGITQN